MKKILHLCDLKKEEIYVLIKKRFKKNLFRDLNKHLNDREISKYIGVKIGTFKYWKKEGENYTYKYNKKFVKSYIPIKYLFSLIELAKTKNYRDYNKMLEKNVVAYKRIGGKPIFKPKFPIKFETEEGAIVAAAILHDGGIAINEVPTYANNESCMRRRVVFAIKKLVGDIKIDFNKDTHLNFPKIIKDILVVGLNMKIGKKVYTNPKIPDIFLKTNKRKIISTFLNQSFSDDGSAYISRSNRKGVCLGISIDVSHLDEAKRKKIKVERLTEYAPNLIKDCKNLLERLRIKVNGPYFRQEYIGYDKSKKRFVHAWGIEILGKENIRRFKDLIGFSIPRKNQKLEEILNSYKYATYGKSIEEALENIRVIKRRKMQINSKNFVKLKNCSFRRARDLLKILRDKGKINVMSGGHIKGVHGYEMYNYEIVK